MESLFVISEIFYWLQVVAAFLMIIFVVLQPSKGSDLGSIAGGGSSNGGKTHIDPATKFTGILLICFMAFSFLISWYSIHDGKAPEKEAFNSTYLTTEQTKDKGDK